MDGVVKKVNANVLVHGLEFLEADGWNLHMILLLVADDTTVMSDSNEKLSRVVSKHGRICERRKLRVDVGKSVVMLWNDEASKISFFLMVNLFT